MNDLIANDLFLDLVEVRRDLHRHPEASWNEFRTAGKICEFLESIRSPIGAGSPGQALLPRIPGADAAFSCRHSRRHGCACRSTKRRGWSSHPKLTE